MIKKYIFPGILLGIAILILFSVQAYAMDYEHKLEAKKMNVFWTIEKDLIHVQLSARTTGWVAIGFDPENAMQGANIIIGAVKNGKVKIEDHYADRKRGHSPDKKLGGENHVQNPQGNEAGGITTISFTLPLDTGDKWDKPIHPQGTSRVMIAYGSGRDSFRAGHSYRSVFDINYTTGETKKIK